VMNTATEHATRTRSVIMKFPGEGFGYRHPGSVESAQGPCSILWNGHGHSCVPCDRRRPS
jgi:hypothetical protein